MKERQKRRSQSEWSELLTRYEERDCSADEFCKLHDISLNTLKYHLGRQTPATPFLPLRSTSESLSEILLELPRGIRLTIRG